MSEITIRPASPLDSKFLIKVIDQADRGHLECGLWEIVFPGTEEQRLKCLRAMVLSDYKSACHWSSFFVAECEGQIAAAVSASRPVDYAGEASRVMDEAFAAAGWGRNDIKAMYERTLPVSQTRLLPDPKSWALQYAYTFPEYRLKGIMRTLITEALQAGLNKKIFRSEAVILIGNTALLEFLRGLGYVVIEEKHDRRFRELTGAPGFYKLARKL